MSQHFNNFMQIERHLDSLGLFHMDMGLDRMRRALSALGLARPPFVTVQILGTNGKGSTAAFLSSLCAAHGLRTGLYTSPHFVSPTERIRVDGQPWPQELWAAQANKVMSAAPELTYFEFITVLALLAFAEEQVDVAILEAGLGGSHDATTAISADMLCFAPIAMDHKDVLGPNLAAIAADKAGAIRSAAPVCSARQFPQAARVLEAAALAQRAPLVWADAVDTSLELGLLGPHQRNNAGLALAAWQQLAPMLGKNPQYTQLQKQGMAQAFIPGRLQYVPATNGMPPLLLDGAHNPHGMTALIKALQQTGHQPAAVVFSCLGDKDWQTAAGMFKKQLGEVPIFVPTLHNPRAAKAEDVAQFFNGMPPATAQAMPAPPHVTTNAPTDSPTATPLDVNGALSTALARAFAHATSIARSGAKAQPVLITGSLYLLAEFFSLYPAYLSPTASAQGRKAHE
ncbi:bifunctional folylpolyglutamate synthase/dihydrofolate synthase [Desulfovibrio intestinalis]|uniref:Dihydrofolate synthase/folylpolyglutamate synthase n=1 Tax=Desulfovibrio intestinalis TaxID=58621 RepID=A0A7W8C129_9BACT|nr:cyanophycin synthetase [Desulfovibrio intestinalis]MBB5142229.1 dihydrofolate synthase/folylpolyglutamate synthase [Desulfovibrio intestinalis]